MADDLAALAAEIEASKGPIDPGLAERVAAALSAADRGARITADELASSETVLHFTDDLVPGWDIRLRGKAMEPDGHWSCTLRRGDGQDDDEFIGTGRGTVPATAILCAVLRTVAFEKGRS